MNPARIASLVIATVLLIGGVAVFYFFGAGGGSSDELPTQRDPGVLESSRSDHDQQLELMTILGDVRFKPDAAGRFREARMPDVSKMTAEEREELSKLMTLPYLQGSTKAGDESNVTAYDPERAANGLNVYTSGHKPEAFVMTMEGTVLHKWQFDIADVWPEVPQTIHSTFWRRVHPYPNGDLLAIYEGIGIVKLDRHSRLKWAYHGGCHHQAAVADDGRVYVLSRQAQVLPRVNPREPVLPDDITILDADGNLISRHSILEAFENSRFNFLLREVQQSGDLFHTNSLALMDGSMADILPYFKKGNVLISCLKIDVIAIVDLDVNQVVWAQSGRRPHPMWKLQHDPTVVDGGNILLFDNQGANGKSKVLELDLRRTRIAWTYDGAGAAELFSKTCGTSRRLANGNTLITESDNGRAVEISSNKQIVWEFHNPHRAGDDGEMVATLFELERVAASYFPWLTAD